MVKNGRIKFILYRFWISNSNFETEVYKSAFWHVHDILEYGHPRNDILFGENKDIKEKVRNKLSIAEGTKTVLYVPTYRESDLTEKFEMDYQRVVHAFEERYDGEWKLLMRMHPKMREKAQKIVPKLTQVVDVSCYPDIQELMVFTDAMITDYSSCIFDFILTYKPGLYMLSMNKGMIVSGDCIIRYLRHLFQLHIVIRNWNRTFEILIR